MRMAIFITVLSLIVPAGWEHAAPFLALVLSRAEGKEGPGEVQSVGENVWTLENNLLRVAVDAQAGRFTVEDKRIGYVWRGGEVAPAATATLTIPRAAHAPQIDGDLADWPEATTFDLTPDMLADAKTVDGPDDCRAQVRVAWDEAALFLGLAVRDEQVVFGTPEEAEWWEKDSVEFWVNAEQYALRLSDAGHNVWSRAGTVAGAEVAVRRTNAGYAAEARVPLAALGVAARPGVSFRFALGVNDADATGQREGQLYSPTTWKHSTPQTFALATLADEQGNVPAQPAVEPTPALRNVRAANAPAPGLTFEADAAVGGGRTIPMNVTLTLDGAEVSLELDLPDRDTKLGEFTVLHPLVLDDPNGAIVAAPYCNGLAVPVNDLSWRGQRWTTYGSLDLPWVGLTDGEKGYLLLWEDPDDGVAVLDTFRTSAGDLLAPVAAHHPSLQTFRYPRRVRYVFMDQGGYVALAKWYRRYAQEQGFLLTLREKAKRRPALERLAGAPDIWGANGLKFCREAKAAGMDRLLINGSWSAADMEAIKDLGYLVSRYDNYEDIREGGEPPYSDCQIPDDAPLRADGQRVLGWLTWDKQTQFYKRCSALDLAVAQRTIPGDLEQHPYNARFLDVTTATGLEECYDPNHPHARSGDREYKRALANYVGNELGLVLGGEHGRWWGADLYDYWEGMQSGGFYSWPAGHVGVNIPQTREEIGERYLEWGLGHRHRLPLWELVFGDCVVSTWYWGDSTGHLYQAAPELAAKQDAFNILYGTVPLYWVSQPYSFRWDDPKLRARLLESYRHTCKLHEQIGFDEMVSHEYVTADKNVQRTRFRSTEHGARGTEQQTVVTVNFGEEPYPLEEEGRTYRLPQYGFFAKGPTVFQYRALAGDRAVTFIRTPGYVFCDAGGQQHDFGVCETDGQVTLRMEGPERLRVNSGRIAPPAPSFARGRITPPAKGGVWIRPKAWVAGWGLKTSRLLRLNEAGEALAARRIQSVGERLRLSRREGDVVLLCGEAARKPDFALAAGDVQIQPAAPQQGEPVSITVLVRNDGGAAGRAAVRLLVDGRLTEAIRPPAPVVNIPPDGAARVEFRLDTASLDGSHRLRVRVEPLGETEELVKRNNDLTVPLTVEADYTQWTYGFDLTVGANGVRRLEEPVELELDLAQQAKLPAGQRVNPDSVRVVEYLIRHSHPPSPGGAPRDDAGALAKQPVPAQWEAGEEAGKGRLVFLLTGETPPGPEGAPTRRFRVVCEAAGGPAHAPLPGGAWDEAEQTVTKEAYQVRFREGVIREWISLLPGAPEKSILTSLGVSSQATGWVDEAGEVERLEVLADGPARTVIRVTKNLRGDYRTVKTYTFYPRHFIVAAEANKPGLMYSRAYYGLPCHFRDDRGNEADIDGRGDGENVIGKNPSPQWYAAYAPTWAHSCVALTPFEGLTYWDAGAWGGVGFGTGRTSDVRLAYVIHPGQANADFAAADYERLRRELVVELGEASIR